MRDGKSAYERDSVLFDKIDHTWPVLAILLKIAALRGGTLSLVDFGGSLGSTYYQCRGFIDCLKSLRWHIVEQPTFVEVGRKEFQTKELQFCHTVEECLEIGSVDALLISSSVQYLEDPFGLLKRFMDLKFDNILLDRITVQRVPPHIDDASYPAWVFNYEKLRSLFDRNYSVKAEFPAFVGDRYDVDGIQAGDRGMWLQRNCDVV